MSKVVTVELPVRTYDETLRYINKHRRRAKRAPLSRIPSGRTDSMRNHPLIRAAGAVVFESDTNKHTQDACARIHAAGRKGTPVRVRRGCR